MTEPGGTDPAKPADPVERNEDGSPKRDLRYSAQQDRNVRVDRKLDGSGHLARGDRTRMSVLNFSSRHQARTERDPEFAFRPPPAPAPAPVQAEAPAAPPPPAPAAPDDGKRAEDDAVQGTGEPSVLARIKKLFGK